MMLLRRLCLSIGAALLLAGPLVAQQSLATPPTPAPKPSTRVGSLAPTAKAEDVGMSTTRLARVREAVQRHIDAGTTPSGVTLVARNGRIVDLQAYGWKDPDKKIPTTKDTIYTIASMSKSITTVAALMLMEEGKLRLADPVARFIPEFKGTGRVKSPEVLSAGAPPGGHTLATKCLPSGSGARWSTPVLPARAAGAGGGGIQAAAGGRANTQAPLTTVPASRDITIRDILTHTSGLWSIGVPNPGFHNGDEPGDTLTTVVLQYAKVPLDFQPGTNWAYSNRAAFDVLSRVIEIVSGQPYDKFLKERIFDPLGMKGAGYHPQTDPARASRLYRPQNLTAVGSSTTFTSGSAGLSMSAEDVWRFAQMLDNRGELNGVRLLSPGTVDMMTSNHVGEMFPGISGISGCGTGHGFGVLTVLDPFAAGLRVPAGAFGWEGQGTHRYWVWPKENIVLVMLIPENGTYVRADFENAVAQAVIH